MKRIVVLVSGRGSNLEALIDATADGRISGKIAAVISNRADALALEKARIAGIPVTVVPDTDCRPEDFETNLLEAVQQTSPDLIVLAGFMKILALHFVTVFEGRIFNIHPSLLPAYKGLDTHRRVLEAGERVHGCSVHFVNHELDAGTLIIQARVEVKAQDTPQSLAARVLVQEHRIYTHAVALFCEDRLELKEGCCYLDGRALSEPLTLD